MNYHSDEWIYNGLNRHYKEALKLYPKERIFAIALRGSQNYSLDLESSDIDSRCIYIPSPEEIEQFPEYIPKIDHHIGNELMACEDIRFITHTLMKRNIYTLEIFYSKYIILPNHQQEIWQQYKDLIEPLITSNKSLVLSSIQFYIEDRGSHTLKDFYPHRKYKIKNGYDAKLLYWIIHLYLVAELISNNQKFELCMDENLNKLTANAKNGIYSYFGAFWLFKFIQDDIKRIKKDIDKNPIDKKLNEQIHNQLKELERMVLQ